MRAERHARHRRHCAYTLGHAWGAVVANAHPHIAGNRIALVHNGIIENFAQLRAELEATGVTMQSQTDTEVLAHLVNFYLEDDLLEALKGAFPCDGAYAVAVFDKRHPERIVGARQGSPMVVGLGEGETLSPATQWRSSESRTRLCILTTAILCR